MDINQAPCPSFDEWRKGRKPFVLEAAPNSDPPGYVSSDFDAEDMKKRGAPCLLSAYEADFNGFSASGWDDPPNPKCEKWLKENNWTTFWRDVDKPEPQDMESPPTPKKKIELKNEGQPYVPPMGPPSPECRI